MNLSLVDFQVTLSCFLSSQWSKNDESLGKKWSVSRESAELLKAPPMMRTLLPVWTNQPRAETTARQRLVIIWGM